MMMMMMMMDDDDECEHYRNESRCCAVRAGTKTNFAGLRGVEKKITQKRRRILM